VGGPGGQRLAWRATHGTGGAIAQRPRASGAVADAPWRWPGDGAVQWYGQRSGTRFTSAPMAWQGRSSDDSAQGWQCRSGRLCARTGPGADARGPAGGLLSRWRGTHTGTAETEQHRALYGRYAR